MILVWALTAMALIDAGSTTVMHPWVCSPVGMPQTAIDHGDPTVCLDNPVETAIDHGDPPVCLDNPVVHLPAGQGIFLLLFLPILYLFHFFFYFSLSPSSYSRGTHPTKQPSFQNWKHVRTG